MELLAAIGGLKAEPQHLRTVGRAAEGVGWVRFHLRKVEDNRSPRTDVSGRNVSHRVSLARSTGVISCSRSAMESRAPL